MNEGIRAISNYNFINKETPEGFDEENNVWMNLENLDYAERFKVSTRGRFTHKRKREIKNSEEENRQKEISPLEENKKIKKLTRKEKKEIKFGQKLEKIKKKHLKFEVLQDKIIEEKAPEIPELKNKKKLSVMITFDSIKKINGFKIFVPLSWGSKVWRLLNYNNIKILGLQEYEHVLNLKNCFTFPKDFPLTRTHSLLKKLEEKEKIEKYFKRPPHNRLNYQRIGFPYPFQSDFSKLGSFFYDLIKVQIKMVAKGIPKNNALICMLKEEDFPLCKKIVEERNPKENSGIIYRESLKQRNLGILKKLTEEKLKNGLANVKIEREILGFVTAGKLTFGHTQASALGFIKRSFDLQNTIHFFGLIRNPKSRYYYLCEITVIN